MTVRERLDKARRTNDKRDRTDRRNGFSAPNDGPADMALRTAMCAIECGLQMEDLDCVAEGYEMLVDLHLKMTGKRYDPARAAKAA